MLTITSKEITDRRGNTRTERGYDEKTEGRGETLTAGGYATLHHTVNKMSSLRDRKKKKNRSRANFVTLTGEGCKGKGKRG
jgi:hypothetical protein